ncbi:late embryogenesis abundant protein D-34-like [Lolium rigidum]|uniref:late embryogenesis abundant protein D-34-like n=1 Tax=Lolium rigidum TaxID=89674 RepID=UPI001F5E1331|nr:late embryogenesis abundant protein D-34-like [Lolium rigidum]
MSIARFSCTTHLLATRQIISRRFLAKMSQGQPRRPASSEQEQGQDGAIRYGDVFPAVSGGLAKKPVAPQDAATMQSAETMAFGETIKGGPAATMQSAATRNERMGVVAHDQATDVAAEQGVSVSETRVPGGRIVTEFVSGQAVGQYLEPDDAAAAGGGVDETKITVGEALEAAGFAAGTRPVERSDAAAIQAAEVRATGMDGNIPGGLAAQAQSAADSNTWAARDGDKATLGDVLSNATAKLVADKEVEADDAARVAFAETRNKQDVTARPGGVAASMAAAARLNK